MMKANNSTLVIVLVIGLVVGTFIGAVAFSSHTKTTITRFGCTLDEWCKEATGFSDSIYHDGYCYYSNVREKVDNIDSTWWHLNYTFRRKI